jgi:hypothetical protein
MSSPAVRRRCWRSGAARTALIAFSIFLAPREASSQGCCSADGGAGYGEAFHQRLSPWELVVGFSYEAAKSGEVFQGGSVVDDPLNRRARAVRFRSALGLGLPRGFGIHLVVPVNDYARSYEVRVGAGSLILDYSAAGLGDPTMAVTRQFPGTPGARSWSVQLGVGLQIPVGEDERREDGIRLPVDVQPAPGGWNVLTFVSSTWSRGAWTAYQSASWTERKANTIGYRFGHSLNASLGFNYELHGSFEPGMELGFAHNGHDVWRDRTLTGTGSTLWLLSMGALAPIRSQHISISGYYRIPIRQSYPGDQLGTHHTVAVSLSYWP